MPVDPVAAVLMAAQAIAVLAFLFVLPGLATGPLVLPGAPTPLHALGRAIGLSLLIVAGACTVLAELGQLRPAPLIAVIGAVTLLPFSRAGWRASLRPTGRAVGRPARWVVLAAGACLVAATVVIPSIRTVGADLLPQTSTPWYYMAIAREMAMRGDIPETIVEWGQARPFPTDYVPATAHAAAALLLLPGDLLTAFAWYRVALLAAAAILAALLLRRWFSTWISVLGACLLLASVRLDAKFLDVRPETFGFVVGLFAIWAADRAMADRSRRSAVLALVATVVVFLSHAEVFLLLGPAFAGLGIGRVVTAGGRLGLRRPRLRSLRPIVLGGALFLAAAAVGSGVNGIVAGEFRLVGYVAAPRAEPPPVPADRIPHGWTFSGDPTWDFYVASVAPALVGQAPPDSFFGSSLLPRAIVAIWPGLDGRTRPGLLTLGALLVAPLIAWPWLDRRRRRFLVTWWVFGVALLAGAWLIFWLSATYVPARVGPRRLMPYELIVPVMSAVLLLFGLDRLLRPAWRLLLPGRGAMAAAGVLLAALTIGAVAPAPTIPGGTEDEPGLTSTGYEALRWIDQNLPADARILTNAYTDGSILAVARRPGIIDGRAVYLEDRDFLAESTSLVMGARVVFAEPAGAAAGAYLTAEHVSHVLVTTVPTTGSDVGGYLPFATDLPGLAAGGRYTLVRSFGSGRLLLYQVKADR